MTRRGSIAPPPASNQQGVHDSRNVRHSCGFAYNGYAWSSCPSCEADKRRQYAMRCGSCSVPFFATECEDLCPECGSGKTVTISAPATPRVR